MAQIEPFWGPKNPRMEITSLKNHQNCQKRFLSMPHFQFFWFSCQLVASNTSNIVKIPILGQINPFLGPKNPSMEGSTFKNHQNYQKQHPSIPSCRLFWFQSQYMLLILQIWSQTSILGSFGPKRQFWAPDPYEIADL